MIGRVLATAVVVVLAGCGNDAAPATTPAAQGLYASGGFQGFYPTSPKTHCDINDNGLTVNIQGSGKTQPLEMSIRTYHGPGVYDQLLGSAATTGATIVVRGSHGARWVAGTGSITVDAAAYTIVSGTLNVSMHPDSGTATGTVDLSGQWRCSVGKQPAASASSHPGTPRAPAKTPAPTR